VLAFKKSLFAGVLDGGENEVFLQGTRLSQFMKSVEQVAGAIGEADADAAIDTQAAAVSEVHEVHTGGETAPPVTPPTAEPADPWGAILEAGAALLQGLAAARAAGGTAHGAASITIERDPVTGQSSVRLPLPEPAVLRQLAKAFEPWLR
jgi:hypothetical protein